MVAGTGVSGRGHFRVAAFKVFVRYALAVFFITISHCAWRRVFATAVLRGLAARFALLFSGVRFTHSASPCLMVWWRGSSCVQIRWTVVRG
jgi:hypothetical protein